MKRRIPRRLREFSPYDLLVVGLPLLLLVVAGFWLASRYIQPAPPDTLVLATGTDGGGYQRYGAAYKDVLARYGIQVVEQATAGSTENLERLRAGEVDAAFLQGGTARLQEGDTLHSLGDLYYEPLWIFYRAELFSSELAEPNRLTEFKGRRLAIGGVGSGARHLARELLQANGIDERNSRLLDRSGLGLARDFAAQRIDAAFVVGPADSAVVWTLLHTPGLKLLSLVNDEAYTRRFPHLSKLTLPRGAIDLATDLPPRDVRMLAATATLVVHEDTHPALISLLMQAASEIHGGPGIFQKPGEFPRPASADFPLAAEAQHYFKSGKPFLQRYLPFWAAILVDRMVVMLIPLFALLIPVMRIAPGLYDWRIKSRIYRRYGELKFIEAELESEPARHTRAEWHARIDAIERDANRQPLPLAFTDMIYTLRSHIALVRAVVDKKTTDA